MSSQFPVHVRWESYAHAAVKKDEYQEDIRRSWLRYVSIDSYHGMQMLMEINKHHRMMISN